MTMPEEKLDALIEGYLAYAKDVRRCVPRTVTDKRCTLRKAVAAMALIRPDTPLWKLALEDYLLWIEKLRQENHSTHTMTKWLSHIRDFLDYAWRSGRADRNVLDGFTLQGGQKRKEPETLGIEDAKRLVDACREQNRRDRMIVLLLYGCGLRTNEVCQLDVGHVDKERCEIEVTGKGSRQRRIPVPEGVWTELLAYLVERNGKRGALFRTEEKRRRISIKDVSDVVKAAAKRAGLQIKITPKVLRHSFGTHLMDQGVDLAVISSLMGHRSPTETGVYLHVLPGRREAAVDKLRKFQEDEQ